jgi:DNA-binding response OmpR family regulator
MLKPSVLVLDSDAATEQLLQDVLGSAGFQVELCDSPDHLRQALTEQPRTAVLLDCFVPNLDAPAFVRSLAQLRPETAILCCAQQPGLAVVLSVLRSGATDFFAKPFLPHEFLARLTAAVARLRAERSELKEWQTRAQRAEQQVAALEMQLSQAHARAGAAPAGRVDAGLDGLMAGFLDATLQTFTALEKEHMDVLRRALPSEDPTTAARLEDPTHTFIAHHDPDFVRGIVKRGDQLRLAFRSPLTTGGEVLDKLGHTPGEILIMSDQLPDIPAEMVLETVRSQHRDLGVVYIEQWGTPQQSVTLSSGAYPEGTTRLMRNVSDLVSILELARERSQEAIFHREFASRFRTRHEPFLRRLQELRQRLTR